MTPDNFVQRKVSGVFVHKGVTYGTGDFIVVQQSLPGNNPGWDIAMIIDGGYHKSDVKDMRSYWEEQITQAESDVVCHHCGSPWCEPKQGKLFCCDCGKPFYGGN